jgi:hypothetical protein
MGEGFFGKFSLNEGLRRNFVIAMKEIVILSLVFTFFSSYVICHEVPVVEQTVMIIFKDWCQSHKTLSYLRH